MEIILYNLPASARQRGTKSYAGDPFSQNLKRGCKSSKSVFLKMIRVSAKKFNMVEDKFHLELFEEYLKIYAQMQYLMVRIELKYSSEIEE